MARSIEMIQAWIQALEDAQPQYGALRQDTVDKVGYPAIDQTGVVRSVEDDRFAFWGAIGYTQGAAGTHVERMMYSSLGGDYPRCKAAGDEEGMALAQRKGEFYETLLSWIKSNEPSGRPMTAVPEWLLPFVELKA